MNAILLLSPDSTITHDEVMSVKKEFGGAAEFWPIYVEALELDGGKSFSKDELDQLAREGIRTIVQIDCQLEAIPRMRPFLRALLNRWGGFIIYENLADRTTLKTLDSWPQGNLPT